MTELRKATAAGLERHVRSLFGSMRTTKDTTFMNRSDSRLDDRGFILVALLVSIAIGSVWMAAALPSWRQQVMRERETELIFRGEQYARAIMLYQRQTGTLPATLDQLVDQHFLRHKWKDPITDDDFLPSVNCAGSLAGPGGSIPGPGGVLAPSEGPPSGGPGATSRLIPLGGGGGRTQVQAPSVTPPGGARSGLQAGLGQIGQGGICGVQSKSKEASIKIYNGQQQHDLWAFNVFTAQQQFVANIARLGGGVAPPAAGLPGGVPGRMGVPGQRGLPGGRGQQPIGPGGAPTGGIRVPGGGQRGVPPAPPMPAPPGRGGRSGR